MRSALLLLFVTPWLAVAAPAETAVSWPDRARRSPVQPVDAGNFDVSSCVREDVNPAGPVWGWSPEPLPSNLKWPENFFPVNGPAGAAAGASPVLTSRTDDTPLNPLGGVCRVVRSYAFGPVGTYNKRMTPLRVTAGTYVISVAVSDGSVNQVALFEGAEHLPPTREIQHENQSAPNQPVLTFRFTTSAQVTNILFIFHFTSTQASGQMTLFRFSAEKAK